MASGPFGKPAPQHIVTPLSSAQAWLCPTAISANLPLGGEAWPESFCPQQVIASSTLSPQVKFSPAEIWT